MTAPHGVVFVVDDDASMRTSLSNLLRSVGLHVETYPSATEFLAARRPDAPSCLVLDVRLPGVSGLDLQHRLADTARIPIVMITGYGDVPMTVQAMKAGATEFLTKPFRDQALLDAVHHALDRDRAERAARADADALRRRYASLTARERRVMALIVSGMPNKQAAGELGTSEATVKVHRRSVMEKMGAGSLPELVRMADRLGPLA